VFCSSSERPPQGKRESSFCAVSAVALLTPPDATATRAVRLPSAASPLFCSGCGEPAAGGSADAMH
jgi:hypothetical protein